MKTTFVCLCFRFVSENEEDRLTPLQKAFLVEFEEEFDADNNISQFTYFLNCGATLPTQMSMWADSIVADRYSFTLTLFFLWSRLYFKLHLCSYFIY